MAASKRPSSTRAPGKAHPASLLASALAAQFSLPFVLSSPRAAFLQLYSRFKICLLQILHSSSRP